MSVHLVARNYYFVKRLHSLLGIVPLSVFLLEHLMVNSLSTVGSREFNAAAGVLASIPYLIAVELGLIIIPLLLHGLLGLWIVYQGSVETRVPYLRNWLYLLQRGTGVIVFIFVLYHLYATRFQHLLHPEQDLYALMAGYVANPLLFAFYLVGVACASFHLGNGLFNFTYKWGIAVSESAQTWAMVIGLLIGVLFFAIGLGALLGFVA